MSLEDTSGEVLLSRWIQISPGIRGWWSNPYHLFIWAFFSSVRCVCFLGGGWGFNVRRCVATLAFPCSSVWGGRGEQIAYYHVNAGRGQIEARPLGGRLNLMACNYTRVCEVLRVMSTQNRPVSSGRVSPADTVSLQQSRAAWYSNVFIFRYKLEVEVEGSDGGGAYVWFSHLAVF